MQNTLFFNVFSFIHFIFSFIFFIIILQTFQLPSMCQHSLHHQDILLDDLTVTTFLHGTTRDPYKTAQFTYTGSCVVLYCLYMFSYSIVLVDLSGLQVWLQGPCWQAGRGDQGDRSFRILPAERHRTDLWCQARLEECCPMCGEDPVVQTTGMPKITAWGF